MGSRFLCGLSKGVARVVLDGWSRGGRGLRAARLRAFAFDGKLISGLVLRTKRDITGICGRLFYRPDAFTRTPSQVETVLRGLSLGDGVVAAAGIQRSAKKGTGR